MQAGAAADLARGQRHTDQRQDERRKRIGVARVLLDLDEVDRVGAFGPLLVQEGVQLRDVHGLDQVVDLAQLGGFEVDQRVEVAELLEGLRARGVELPFGVARGGPAFGLGVELGVRGFERVGHRAAFVAFQHEERGLAGAVVVAADVGERPRLDLPVDVAVELGVLLAFYVLRLEIDDVPLRNGDQPEVERQRQRGDDQRPEEVGPHQPAERHAAREHGHDLGLVGHLRGEEDAGDEGEQAAELVDEVGDEVEVVVEDDRFQGCVQLREVVDLLHVVEDHHDHDDHGDGEEIGRQELAQYVTVQNLEPRKTHFHLFGCQYFSNAIHSVWSGSSIAGRANRYNSPQPWMTAVSPSKRMNDQ